MLAHCAFGVSTSAATETPIGAFPFGASLPEYFEGRACVFGAVAGTFPLSGGGGAGEGAGRLRNLISKVSPARNPCGNLFVY